MKKTRDMDLMMHRNSGERMKVHDAYETFAHSLRSVMGEWEPALNHLRDLGWTHENWESWVNECQCGSLAVPGYGLALMFQADAESLGLAQNLRGNGDDVATCLACLWLWVSLDHLVPVGQERVLDRIVDCLASTASGSAD